MNQFNPEESSKPVLSEQEKHLQEYVKQEKHLREVMSKLYAKPEKSATELASEAAIKMLKDNWEKNAIKYRQWWQFVHCCN